MATPTMSEESMRRLSEHIRTGNAPDSGHQIEDVYNVPSAGYERTSPILRNTNLLIRLYGRVTQYVAERQRTLVQSNSDLHDMVERQNAKIDRLLDIVTQQSVRIEQQSIRIEQQNARIDRLIEAISTSRT